MTTSPEASTTSPKRRSWQFRLRTLLLVVLAVALCVAWISSHIRERRREQQVLSHGPLFPQVAYGPSWYENAGFESEHPLLGPSGGETSMVCAQWRGPAWLREFFDPSEATFHRVTTVYFRGERFDDAVIDRLNELRHLESLALERTAVTEAALLRLDRLEHLQRLSIAYQPVSRTMLRRIAGLRNLKRLYLNCEGVSASNLKWLQTQLPECEIIPPYVPAF